MIPEGPRLAPGVNFRASRGTRRSSVIDWGLVERKVRIFKASALLVAGVASVLSIACDSSCENAKEKIEEECHHEIERALHDSEVAEPAFSWDSDACNEDEECVADCINDADCEALAYLMVSGVRIPEPRIVDPGEPESARELNACVYDCGTHR